MTGPLDGIRVLELAGIGPGPHAAMILADLGAEVVRVSRPGQPPTSDEAVLRGRRHVVADLRDVQDRDAVLDLVERADVLVEGFRPGVTERLGLGPEACLERNPRLVYARMTGWGQTGPLSKTAGHDINYLSITGLLHAIGTADRPIPPLNVVGDYGGGSMFLVLGVTAALLQRERTGRGDVVDAAMVDGVSVLSQLILDLRAEPSWGWTNRRESNLIDGGAPFYRTYRCADGRFIAVGAMERQFFEMLAEGVGLNPEEFPDHMDASCWPVLEQRLTALIAEHSRDHWQQTFEGTDACVTPVLTFDEAAQHPHVVARRSLSMVDGRLQAGPAPRFSMPAEPARSADVSDLVACLERWTPR
ncbi:CaiB/BaiF CoA transferase family protein [Rhodococcus sp. NPDC127530]|uniref:CaiB/BaiF CoA transferase family protein n=1 Tax=unclassified Rhodococcus (in: high G+C Gram-positive bacteria) TaxID=192944 RepID=UPI003633BE74